MPYSQSNTVSFTVAVFLSGLTGSELCLFRNLSQLARLEKIDKFVIFQAKILVVFYRRSRVCLWVASADIACLSLDDANGAL